MQDVVGVGRDNQLANRQTHLLSNIACKDIAEIARRHGKADLAMRRTQRHRRGEVINHLCQHAAPVDRIHASKAHVFAELEIVEHIFDQRLAAVEIAIDRDGVDIRFGWRRHLAALHL